MLWRTVAVLFFAMLASGLFGMLLLLLGVLAVQVAVHQLAGVQVVGGAGDAVGDANHGGGAECGD